MIMRAVPCAPVGVPLFLLTYFGFTITINVFLRWILDFAFISV